MPPRVQKQTNRKRVKKAARKGGLKRKSGGIASRITTLEKLKFSGINMCVFGKCGTGKTRFAGSFNRLGKLLHIVCSGNGENEARSIVGLKNIEVVELDDPDELPELVEFAKGKYKTLVLDHVTEFGDRVLARIIGLERLPEQSDWGLAKQDDYKQMGLQVKTYLRDFLDFEGNCLILGQERVYDKSEDGDDIIAPYVNVASTPAVAGWIGPACDYVAQTFIREEIKVTTKQLKRKTIKKKTPTGKYEYCLRTGSSDVFTTKFRVPPGVDLPSSVVDPTYEKIRHLLGE